MAALFGAEVQIVLSNFKAVHHHRANHCASDLRPFVIENSHGVRDFCYKSCSCKIKVRHKTTAGVNFSLHKVLNF